MIRIRKVEKKRMGDKARVVATIIIDDVSYQLWYEVEAAYENALCADRSDAFVVGLLPLAFKKRENIFFDTPITWELLDGLTYDFIDVLCQHQPELYRVTLIGDTCNAIEKKEEVVGTGVSCGVDSLFTIQRRLVGDKKYKRYLLLNNMTDEDGFRSVRYNSLKRNAKSFANEVGIDLIVSNSNYTSGEIPGLCSEGATTYCNLFSVLSLQNIFTRYYIASGGPICDFSKYINDGFFETDCSNYDLLTLSACSTSSCRFIVDGFERRISKMQSIVNWPLTWTHLDVCFVHSDVDGMNGTNDCPKCMHTVVEILISGGMSALEHFNKVFNVQYVKEHMEEYLADLIRIKLQGSEYGEELWPLRKNANFTVLDYLKAFMIVFKKITKKILRFGKINNTFTSRG